MIAVLICVIFICLIIWQYVHERCTVGTITLLSLVSPYISVGSGNYDGLYFAIPIMLGAITIKNKGKLKKLKGVWGKRYQRLNLFLCAVYFIAWIIFSRIDFGITIVSLLGIVKYLLLIYLAYATNPDKNDQQIKESITRALVILVLLNTVACITQLISVDLGTAIVKAYGSTDSISYLNAVTRWGFFSRCFGVLRTPMELGMVMSFVFGFFLISEKKLKYSFLYLALSVFCGACSASKSFWVGLIAVVMVKILTEARFSHSARKAIIQIGGLIVAVVLVVALYDYIGNLIQNYLGGTFAQYWRQLSDISSIFSTRYSEESEFLWFLPEFMKEYWLMGVGPSSVAGERAIDSAIANTLHNGGIIALVAILVFYIRLLIACWNRKMQIAFSMALLLVLFGLGFQTWIGASSTTFILIYVFMELDGNRNNNTASAPVLEKQLNGLTGRIDS